MKHVFCINRAICMACAKTQEALLNESGPSFCAGTVRYREFIRGLTFVCEPIVPKGQA